MPVYLSGQLSTFHTGPFKYPYFTTGDLNSKNAVVFIGGLFCGLGSTEYTHSLGERLGENGWQMVLMHWSNAYDGFGGCDLDKDVREMGDLVKHLRQEGIEKVVLMGHSTGSQDVLRYLSSQNPDLKLPEVDGGIMQGPASDREFFEHEDEKDKDGQIWLDQLPIARKMITEGKGHNVLGKEFCEKAGCRLSANRLVSLIGKEGDDDYFSHDLPLHPTPDNPAKHPLSETFGKMYAPGLAIYSEKDEYGKNTDLEGMLSKWETAAGGKLETKILRGTSHAVGDDEGKIELGKEVVGWLKRVIE